MYINYLQLIILFFSYLLAIPTCVGFDIMEIYTNLTFKHFYIISLMTSVSDDYSGGDDIVHSFEQYLKCLTVVSLGFT